MTKKNLSNPQTI